MLSSVSLQMRIIEIDVSENGSCLKVGSKKRIHLRVSASKVCCFFPWPKFFQVVTGVPGPNGLMKIMSWGSRVKAANRAINIAIPVSRPK